MAGRIPQVVIVPAGAGIGSMPAIQIPVNGTVTILNLDSAQTVYLCNFPAMNAGTTWPLPAGLSIPQTNVDNLWAQNPGSKNVQLLVQEGNLSLSNNNPGVYPYTDILGGINAAYGIMPNGSNGIGYYSFNNITANEYFTGLIFAYPIQPYTTGVILSFTETGGAQSWTNAAYYPWKCSGTASATLSGPGGTQTLWSVPNATVIVGAVWQFSFAAAAGQIFAINMQLYASSNATNNINVNQLTIYETNSAISNIFP